MRTKSPKLFLSHASEDKKRFVLPLAALLRSKGIDVWLDQWEMLPGDSLVDKIFQEGIGESDAIVVVVSRHSIEKRWVKEELNAAVVRRINEGSLLIPIVLDQCQVPVALQSTLYIPVAHPAQVDLIAARVANALFRQSDKPPLGKLPSYIHLRATAFTDLDRADGVVLTQFVEIAIEKGCDQAPTELVWKKAERLSLSRAEFIESLCVLVEAGYLRGPGVATEIQPFFFIPTEVFEEYFASTDSSFREKVERVAAAATNLQKASDGQIAASTGLRQFVVRVILESLERRGLLEIWRPAGPHIIIGSTTARLRRQVQGGTIGDP